MHTGTCSPSLDIYSKQGFNEIQISYKAFVVFLEHSERNPLVLRRTATSQQKIYELRSELLEYNVHKNYCNLFMKLKHGDSRPKQDRRMPRKT